MQPSEGSVPDTEAMLSEIEALKQQNAALAQQAQSPGWRSTLGHSLRTTAVVVLVVLGTICMTVSPVAIWGRNLVLNTDRYVETLKPIAENTGMQDAIIAAVDRRVEQYVDIPAALEGLDALPPAVVKLVGPALDSAITGLVNNVVTKFVRSDAFVTLWVTINRTAHTQLVRLLTGKTSALVVDSSGKVVLDLSPIVETVKKQLVDAGITVAQNIPAVGATIEIAELDGLASAQKGVRALNTLANWLPWVGLALLAGAVATARRRRRTLIASMLAVAGGMVVVGFGILIGRHFYINGVPPAAIPTATAKDLFDTFVRFLRDGIRIVAGVALFIALVAWMFGPSRPARGIRHWFRTAPPGAASRVANGRVGEVAAAQATALTASAVGFGLLLILLWNNPSTAVMITIAVLVVLVVLLVQLQRWAVSTGRWGHRPVPLES